jgi:UDP-3-O-[3-hydroxymyristoyl] glucosamine N-acyltransferase
MALADSVGDPRFFARSGPHSLATIATLIGAEPLDHPAASQAVTGIAPLQTAGPDDISFLDNKRYAPLLEQTRAGAVIVAPAMRPRVPPDCVALVTPEPYVGWARVAALFHPEPPPNPGIHPSALVAADAEIDSSAEIGPFVVVQSGARIGAHTAIAPFALIGCGVVLGQHCRIGAHVSISHAVIGDRVRLYPGVRVGQDGFGFAITKSGGIPNFLSVPQLGRVLIDDDVEVGANTTIDRGSAHDTRIGAGSRIDNLVMLAHNVQLGRCCVIVSQSGISGSTVLGDFVMVAGQAGLTGHLKIGDGAKIGAQAGVMADVAAGAEVVGSPAEPLRDYFRHVAYLRRAARQARGATSGKVAPGASPTDGESG